MDKLLFGTAGIPIKTEPRTYNNAFKDLLELDLGCMEIEFVRGVNMNAKTQAEVKEKASAMGLVLTAHGPYYVNLSAQEEDKIHASIKRILDTARVAYACGGYSITFHAGFYMGGDKEKVYGQIKAGMSEIINTLKKENIKIWVRPETTGKATQWGDLDEIIRLSNEFDMVLPCVDFSHLHARSGGKFNTYDEFAMIFEKIGKEIGDYALENFHAHIAGIEYTAKGEKKHLMLKESDMNYKDLMKAFKDFNVKGAIICESPVMEDDAVLLHKTYQS
ncbi:MAG: TIM barrel protein [Candidatus Gastranaerophilales bacterium]|nr:TIM barrel protein [Candidatus Gastranaerophilales bacterium]